MLLSKVPEKKCDSSSTIWLNCRNETLKEHSWDEKTSSRPICSPTSESGNALYGWRQGFLRIYHKFLNEISQMEVCIPQKTMKASEISSHSGHKHSRVVLNLGLYERVRWLCRNLTTWTSCTNTPARDGQNKKMLKKEERFLIWIGPAKASVPTRAA